MKSVMVSIPTNFWRLLSHSGAARTPAIANQSISRLKIISGMGWAAAYRCERAQRRLSWRAAECRRRLTLHWSVWDRNTCGTWRTWQIFDSRHLLSRYKIEKHFNSTNSIQAKQKWKRAESKYWYRKWGIVGSFCDWMTQKKLIPKSNFQAIGQRDHKKNRSYFVLWLQKLQKAHRRSRLKERLAFLRWAKIFTWRTTRRYQVAPAEVIDVAELFDLIEPILVLVAVGAQSHVVGVVVQAQHHCPFNRRVQSIATGPMGLTYSRSCVAHTEPSCGGNGSAPAPPPRRQFLSFCSIFCFVFYTILFVCLFVCFFFFSLLCSSFILLLFGALSQSSKWVAVD